jgi:hypothetical protein
VQRYVRKHQQANQYRAFMLMNFLDRVGPVLFAHLSLIVQQKGLDQPQGLPYYEVNKIKTITQKNQYPYLSHSTFLNNTHPYHISTMRASRGNHNSAVPTGLDGGSSIHSESANSLLPLFANAYSSLQSAAAAAITANQSRARSSQGFVPPTNSSYLNEIYNGINTSDFYHFMRDQYTMNDIQLMLKYYNPSMSNMSSNNPNQPSNTMLQYAKQRAIYSFLYTRRRSHIHNYSSFHHIDIPPQQFTIQQIHEFLHHKEQEEDIDSITSSTNSSEKHPRKKRHPRKPRPPVIKDPLQAFLLDCAKREEQQKEIYKQRLTKREYEFHDMLINIFSKLKYEDIVNMYFKASKLVQEMLSNQQNNNSSKSQYLSLALINELFGSSTSASGSAAAVNAMTQQSPRKYSHRLSVLSSDSSGSGRRQSTMQVNGFPNPPGLSERNLSSMLPSAENSDAEDDDNDEGEGDDLFPMPTLPAAMKKSPRGKTTKPAIPVPPSGAKPSNTAKPPKGAPKAGTGNNGTPLRNRIK